MTLFQNMKVVLDTSFVKELETICDYIASNNPNNSYRFKDELLILLDSLKNMPFRFRKSQYYNNENIRELIFKGFSITYKIDKSENLIQVIGIFKNINR